MASTAVTAEEKVAILGASSLIQEALDAFLSMPSRMRACSPEQIARDRDAAMMATLADRAAKRKTQTVGALTEGQQEGIVGPHDRCVDVRYVEHITQGIIITAALVNGDWEAPLVSHEQCEVAAWEREIAELLADDAQHDAIMRAAVESLS